MSRILPALLPRYNPNLVVTFLYFLFYDTLDCSMLKEHTNFDKNYLSRCTYAIQ